MHSSDDAQPPAIQTAGSASRGPATSATTLVSLIRSGCIPEPRQTLSVGFVEIPVVLPTETRSAFASRRSRIANASVKVA